MFLNNSRAQARHISDEEILCHADGELSGKRCSEIQAHLEACWDCRSRLEQFQSAIVDFARVHRAEYEEKLPPMAGPRALLRARLSALDSAAKAGVWQRAFRPAFVTLRPAMLFLCLLAVAVGVLRFRNYSSTLTSSIRRAEPVPDSKLTPGATRQISMSEACSSAGEEVAVNVPVSVRKEVFEEYGIPDVQPGDYEIDYLIAPRLGGVEDIRNLWPESYRTAPWNARVKDALEERLHAMVCSGQIDLATAQREISTNWIAAYKKYFHTSAAPASL